MRLNLNPNACASEIIADVFNGSVSLGIDVCIVASDDNSVTLGKWRFGDPLPKAFTLTQRSAGTGCRCVGGYLKQVYTEGHDLLGKKCFIEVGGTMRNRTIKIRLDTAKQRMTDRHTALVSFDPTYSEE
jgi:hypothetical protein